MTVQTEVKTYGNFIDGKWISAASKKVGASFNPAHRDEIVGYVQSSTEEDVDKAVTAAHNAKEKWRKLSGSERGDFLYKIANCLESRLDDIAETLTREMGKTLPEARGETLRGIAILRYYAGEGMRKTGDVIPATDSKALMYTTRVPLGVVGIITPWNFPVAIPIWKIAPALIYGNTVVVKPAQEAAVTCAKIIECIEQAGLPAGVVNLVTGKGSIVGQRIIDHPGINGISFTGSNDTGKKVAIGAINRGVKYQLEMGGKNPIIVANDADIDEAVEATISGGLRSTGQKCTATSRVIVQNGIYEEFKKKLVERTKELKLGDGLKEGTWMGPCVNESQLNTVLSYIVKGKEEGAVLLLGGRKSEDTDLKNGYFVEPTIFEGVHSRMTIGQEEIFGPVLALIKVETPEEAIELANDVHYGLSASIFTKNIGNAFDFIDGIDAGLVRVNYETAGVELHAPFGGMKSSSFGGREQGTAAIEFYTSIKTVYVKP
ncbi:alpha-ketoglutaric semialdehyde dehydrogenase GucD [Bacillus sp. USDA818B3_A]|uniref:alpha-ketoglutaric semialdehyde dehydrogenase GucD n=1 Tax=Bacillus sp. USDA818B3_A TaxID=2698834 RepID=UPI00136F13A8|nr:alpha-ketoglutaric semialdehyde dehydrogenase GucD [Bacillus sp. USDA818B3_A]